MCTYLCARVLSGEMDTGKESAVLRAGSRQTGPVGRGCHSGRLPLSHAWASGGPQVLWVLRGPSISPSPAGLGPRRQLPGQLTTWSACPVQPRGPRALVPPLAGPGSWRAGKDMSAPLPCSGIAVSTLFTRHRHSSCLPSSEVSPVTLLTGEGTGAQRRHSGWKAAEPAECQCRASHSMCLTTSSYSPCPPRPSVDTLGCGRQTCTCSSLDSRAGLGWR